MFLAVPSVTFQEASTVLTAIRVVLPIVLAGTLTVLALFRFLDWVGRRATSYRPIEIQELADDEAEGKAKGHDSGEDEEPSYPRKIALLLPLNILGFCFLVDAVALIIDTVCRKAQLDFLDLGTDIAALSLYSLAALMLVADGRPESTWDAKYAIFAIATFVSMPAAVAALAIKTRISGARDPLHIIYLITASLRAFCAVAFACAYHPKFRYTPSDIEDDEEDETRPLLNDAAAANGRDVCKGKLDGEQSEEDDDYDSDDEEDQARFFGFDDEDDGPLTANYDMLAVVRRMRRLLPYIVPLRTPLVRILVVACVILSLSQNVSNVLLPRQLGKIVSDLSDGKSPWFDVLIWFGLEVGIGWAGILSIVRKTLWTPVGMLAEREISTLSFQHVLNLSARYHNKRKTGELLSTLGRADSASEFLDVALFTVAPVVIDYVVGVVYFYYNFGMTLVLALAVTTAGYFAASLYTRQTRMRLRAVVRDREDRSAGIKNDSISQVELVKYSSAEAYEASRYLEAVIFRQRALFERIIYNRTFTFSQGLIVSVGMVVMMAIAANEVSSGRKSIGSFVSFNAYMAHVIETMSSLEWTQDYINSLMVGTEKVCDLLETKNEIVDRADAIELYRCHGQLAFENVSFSYEPAKADSQESPRKALDGVSFTIEQGQRVAIVGPTGAGKSTIFRLLFRFFDVQGGAVKVDGRDVRDYTQTSLRKSLGIVQQEASLFNDTILANIKYGDITASDEKVIAAAKAAKIHDRIAEWPQKYKTQVGDRGVKLSGGEKQRVTIARTILKNADVLLLDESTSALDTSTEREIQAELRKLTEGKTVVAIAHRLSTIAASDKILVMDKGKIVEEGRHSDLLKIEDGHYRRLWEAQIAAGNSADAQDSSLAVNAP